MSKLTALLTLLIFGHQVVTAQALPLKRTTRLETSFKKALNQNARISLELIAKNAFNKANHYARNPRALQAEFGKHFEGKALNENLQKNVGNAEKIKIEKNDLELIITSETGALRISLEKLFQNKLLINGNEIDLTRIHSKEQALKLLLTLTPEAPKASFLDIFKILPRAHAIEPITIVVVAIVALLGVDFVSFLKNLAGIKEHNENFEQLSKKMNATIDQCNSDLEGIKTEKNNEIISNETTEFIEYLAYRKYDATTYKEPELLSCENLSNKDGVLVESPIFSLDLFSKVKEMCALGERLDACIQETKREIENKGIATYDTRDSKDEFNQESPYHDFIQTFDRAKGN